MLRSYADMSAASNNRVLRIALAGSLAVHLMIAAIIYSRPTTVKAEPPPQHLRIVEIAPPTPRPTPPPRKPALPHPQHHAIAVRPAVKPVHIAQLRPIGPPIGPAVEPSGDPVIPVDSPGPDVAPTDGPVAPTPTPKPACSAPDIAAKTVVTQSPDVPEDQLNGFSGTAKVKVDLDASGAVVGTSIYESTGNMQLDRAAVSAARESRYAPEERDCKNVAGSYLFTVDFQ